MVVECWNLDQEVLASRSIVDWEKKTQTNIIKLKCNILIVYLLYTYTYNILILYDKNHLLNSITTIWPLLEYESLI